MNDKILILSAHTDDAELEKQFLNTIEIFNSNVCNIFSEIKIIKESLLKKHLNLSKELETIENERKEIAEFKTVKSVLKPVTEHDENTNYDIIKGAVIYIDNYGNDIDIMIEAKHKELAVNKYKSIHINR